MSLQSVDNVDEVLMAYETQKKVIQQLQASLNMERDRASKAELATRFLGMEWLTKNFKSLKIGLFQR